MNEPTPSAALEQELLELTEELLASISAGDWETYARLCSPAMTAFEPEGRGHLIEGLEFHRFYFEHGGHMGPHRSTLLEPRVRMLGPAAALVTYTRLVQRITPAGEAPTMLFEETRIWQNLVPEGWRHIHFHRSRVE